SLSITEGTITGGVYSEKNIRYIVAEPIRIEISDTITSVVGFSDVINVDHANAYQIVKLSGDSTGVTAGDSVLLNARVFDPYGNRVDAQAVSFSVQRGNGGLAASQQFSNGAGYVSVMFGTGTTAGSNRVRAAILDGSPEGLETQIFEITTLPVDSIAYVDLSIAGSSFEAGEWFNLGVDVYDKFDNLIVTDDTTRLIPVSEFPSIDFSPDTLTLNSGHASFTACDTVMGTNRVAVLSSGGDTLAPFSALLTIDHAPVYRIVEISGDTTGVISGTKTELKVRVSDRYENPVDDEITRFTITSNLGGSPSLSDGTGAPDDGLVLTGLGGTAICSLTTDTNAGENVVSASILDGDPPGRERVEFS
ncbi:MAG: hypothetical protein KAX38_02365, partial [Candidatus Krumholzibacteria bacterium]|nr:hypothetical protein [Candidatus Krumholzibacteria bacterium]